MADQDNAQDQQQNPSLEALEVLVGEWQLEVTLPSDPPTTRSGQATFGWYADGAFLTERQEIADDRFPIATAIIGRDEAGETYTMLYFDSRGVSRLYQMSLEAGVWKLWRDALGFSQRFSGTFSEDGSRVEGAWEKSQDGSTWEHDFKLTYIKADKAI